MKEFSDKVAVITGGASGIGLALAEKAAQEGMKVVLADIEEEALAEAAAGLRSAGAQVLAVRTDVSQIGDVEALAEKTLDAFGAVHLLCNNAGVGAGTTVWESTLADWEWVLGVNLWGVIYGVHVFTPIMLAQDTESHILNTASLAGLISGPALGIYKVTKHGVVTLSETLYHELAARKAKIKVSVLCPGFVKTGIAEAERNRPAALQNDPALGQTPEAQALREEIRQLVETGISATEVSDCVFKAIRENKFYIYTHPNSKLLVELRMEDLLYERNPTDSMADESKLAWLKVRNFLPLPRFGFN